MIPAETIDKQAPATTATIGLPFTYTLTMPAMNFPVGEDPSPNDLGNIESGTISPRRAWLSRLWA